MSRCYCAAPATAGNLCTADLARLKLDLERVPGILRDLDITITGQAKQGGGGNGGTPDVFNETASDRRQDLMVILRSAAHAADPRGYGQTAPALVARALGGLYVLARNPDAHIIAQDLRDYLQAAERCMDRAEEKITYGQCTCGVELVAPKSRDTARCRECGQVWDVAQLRAFRHVAALDRVGEYVGTATDVVRVLTTAGYPVNHSTVRSWIRRGTLEPVKGGKYAARDVMELSQKA